MEETNKKFIDAVMYQIGDEVIRMGGQRELESKLTKLDYGKVLKVRDVKDLESEDYRFRILQFEGSLSWHPAIDYLPADPEIRKEVIEDCYDVHRQAKKISESKRKEEKKDETMGDKLPKNKRASNVNKSIKLKK